MIAQNIKSYKGFEKFIDESKYMKLENKTKYKIILSVIDRELFDILLKYESLKKDSLDLYKKIMLFIKININTQEDFKNKFGDIYCETQENDILIIKELYKSINFIFSINCSISKDNDINSFLQNIKSFSIIEQSIRYSKIVNSIYYNVIFIIKNNNYFTLFNKVYKYLIKLNLSKTDFEFDIENALFLNHTFNSQFNEFVTKISRDLHSIIRLNVFYLEDCQIIENIFSNCLSQKYFPNVSFNLIVKFPLFKLGTFTMQGLHELTLLCCKYKKHVSRFILTLNTKQYDEVERLKAYFAVLITDKLNIYCNNVFLFPDIVSIGKIPPSIFIESEHDLSFFQNPIKKEIWDIICKKNKDSVVLINSKTFDNDTIDYIDLNYLEMCKKYWPYLRMCQRFLFEEFQGNESKNYNEIRCFAFQNHQFYDKFAKDMSFLSICIFSLYDNYYRNDLLKKYKEDTKTTIFNDADFLLSKQREQEYNRFEIYEKVKTEYDIKNLLINKEDYTLHRTIEAEIFECISLSEGLLQILENALLHAEGGLLSLRVYDRSIGIKTNTFKNSDNVKYLNHLYGVDYFSRISATFFLEVQISDLSSMSIPEKFIDNHKKNDNDIEIYNHLNNNIKDINLNYFFHPNKQQNVIKRLFYQKNNNNIVHHYGLEIFNSILTARNGILAIASHEYFYNNLNEIYEKMYSNLIKYAKSGNMSEDLSTFFKEINEPSIDSKISTHIKKILEEILKKIEKINIKKGTSYKVLFPLNHSRVLNNYSANNEIIVKENISFLKSNFSISIIDKESLLNFKNNNETVKEKQNNVQVISDIINKKYDNNGNCLCINMYDSSRRIDNFFEIIIKGILLFSLKKSQATDNFLPIAIVNLSSFQLIEATRIIATYYNREKTLDNQNFFEKIPIYLKCIDTGKEVIFSGKNVSEVKDRIIKLAMTNGMMFSELLTIANILNN